MRFWPGILLGLGASAAHAQTYDHGNPSNDEQLVLEMINRARKDPGAEGVRLGIDIKEGLSAADAARVQKKPPLAFNADLLAAAEQYSQYMWDNNFFAHNPPAPLPASTPTSRMTAAGYNFSGSWRSGENIASGSGHTAAMLEDLLMVDAGIAGRGHRKNLLDIYASAPFREVGIGFIDAGSSKSNIFRFVMTQDFARTGAPEGGPFLVGVAINDGDSDSFYDLGEGLNNVTITVSGQATNAVTSNSGGFAVPIGSAASGSIDITATRAGWPGPIVKSAFRTGENLKVDFRQIEATDTDGDGMPDFWETLYGLNPGSNADAAGDLDGDTHTNLTEFRFGSAPNSATSTPSNPGGTPPPPPPPADDDDDDDSSCGLTGLEAFALLGLLRLFRRTIR